MAKVTNVTVSKKGADGEFYSKSIGIAVHMDGRIAVKLDSLPLPNEKGETWIQVWLEKRSK